MAHIEFWYEFASTYSYPAAMRFERLASDAGIAVRWRPFLLGPILKEQGLKDSPFNIFAAKGRYMWRDLERICDEDGLPLRLPPVRFPQNGLKAARLAIVGERQGWTPPFTRAVFVANYAEQRDIAADATLVARHSRWARRRHGFRARRRPCARHQGRAQTSNRGGGRARVVRRAVLHHWQ